VSITLSLEGRVALVTGAGAGIGAAIASVLAEAGAAVAANDIDAGRAEQTAAAIRERGGQAIGVAADVTDEDQVRDAVARCQAELGGLDIAVNNVGMMGGLGPLPVTELTGTYIRKIVEQNLIATMLCCGAEAKAMVAAGRGGVIINVSSGETTRAVPSMSVYAAAKTGINHLTKTMAVELGPAGIRVLAVAPGTTPTEHVRERLTPEVLDALAEATPLRSGCAPEDLANLVLLLVSDRAALVTGQFVLADAGAHLSLQRPAMPQ
jgi:NAD(P)-dependent dehydrogenase (short-subunit alcohol dehydrogenase family)